MNTVLNENSLKSKMLVGFFLSFVKLNQEARDLEVSPKKLINRIDMS